MEGVRAEITVGEGKLKSLNEDIEKKQAEMKDLELEERASPLKGEDSEF